MAVDNCDLLIAVGCRFSDRVALDSRTFADQARIVQIDIDRSEINKNVKTDHHIIGDAKRVLQLLNAQIDQQHHDDWKGYVFSFKTETEYDAGGDTLTPKQISDAIARLCPKDTIVATDVGQHQMWVAQHFHYDYPGQLLTSGGFGAMATRRIRDTSRPNARRRTPRARTRTVRLCHSSSPQRSSPCT